jgi:hypothetical protein
VLVVPWSIAAMYFGIVFLLKTGQKKITDLANGIPAMSDL